MSRSKWAALAALVVGGGAIVGAAQAARVVRVQARGVTDGTADDRAPDIQAALDAAEARGGGVVELGDGVFPIRRALRLPSRVTLRGKGPARTTVRLVALDTRGPERPAECPPLPPQPVPAAAIYNGANAIMRVRAHVNPGTSSCGDAYEDQPLPPDRDLALVGFTLECNAPALWGPGLQAAGNGNMGCIELDRIDGMLLEDLVVKDAAIDGIELGWSAGVERFTIRRARIEGSQRYGIGWIAAARGLIVDTVLDGNWSGGVDLEPIGKFGSSGVAHDVTLRDVRVHGMRGRARAGRDAGVILCFTKLGVTRAIHLERVVIEDVLGTGVQTAWGGDYEDLRLDVDVRRAELGGVAIAGTGSGSGALRGRLIETGLGPDVLGSPVGFSGHEAGWRVGPLEVVQAPRWGNGTVLVIPPGSRDTVVRGVHATIGCNPADSGCRASRLAGGRRTGDELHPSVVIEDSTLTNSRATDKGR